MEKKEPIDQIQVRCQENNQTLGNKKNANQRPGEETETWLRSIDTSSNNLKRGPGHGFEV